MRKTLKNILYGVPLIALTSLLPSCGKEDITPPKINILSPLEGQIFYENRIVPIELEIEDENDFKSGWLSVNGGEKFPFSSKSFSINWYCKNGDNKLVVGAEDLNSNASKDSTGFYIWSDLIKDNKTNYLK